MSLDLGSVTYTLSSVFLLLLAIAQVRIWSQGNSSMVLLGATLVTFLWSSVLIFREQIPVSSFYLVQVLEIFKNLAWIFLLLSILGIRRALFSRMRGGDYPGNLLIIAAISLGLPLLLALYVFYYRYVDSSIPFYPEFGGRGILAGFLMIAITGLALLEQVIRNIRFHHVWHLKFLCLSLGVLFTYDIYLYSDALLFARIEDQLWQARGGVTALATPLIAISVLRSRQQPMQVNISRQLVFHTGVLVAAGFYLLLMGLAGYYIRNYSGEWGLVLQVLFWVISLTLLVVLIYSERMRSTFKLYINRHLFSSKYDYRDEWMRISETLSATSVDESLQERVIHALANIVDSGGGAMWLTVDNFHYDQVAHLELGWIPDSHLTNEDYLINHMQEEGELIDLSTTGGTIDQQDLPAWLQKLKQAWLLVPLQLNERLLGFVLLKESRVDYELNWEDYELMKAAGQQAASYLAQMIASDELSEVREFSAFNQVSAFVVHDLKTLNSQLSLLVRNAEKHKDNPSFVADMIKTTEHAVDKMSFLLHHFQKDRQLDNGQVEQLNLVNLASEVVQAQLKLKPRPTWSCDETDISFLGNAEELKSSFGHLIQNAQEATPDDGTVEVSLTRRGNDAVLIVADSGSGMSQEFINTRLFKPFQSTKGVAGMGMGVFQSRATIRKLGGDLQVQSVPDEGTTFTVTLPLQPVAQDAAQAAAD